MPPADRRLRASSIASSSASLVPEPIEKCAVCAASPISTTGTLRGPRGVHIARPHARTPHTTASPIPASPSTNRSEEHTSELQAPPQLLCPLRRQKKKIH